MNTTTICDSIALKVLSNNKVVQAIGNELHIIQNRNPLEKLSPVENIQGIQHRKFHHKFKEKIHGIEYEKSRNILMTYGAKEFALISHDDKNKGCSNDEEFKLISNARITDWISSGIFGQNQNENAIRFFLLTAHSVLLNIEFNDTFRIIKKWSCSDKSTLYCSNLMHSSVRNLMVFGGNAFGEVIIWTPVFKDDDHCPVLHRISAHKGVIFSIDVNMKFMMMITTSDDRSIRFWKIANNDITKNRNSGIHVDDWRNKKIIPHKSGYAHTARVFKGKIIENCNHQFAVTVGEDSNLCLWNSNGELIFKRRHHFDAIIWNLDYHPETMRIFTTSSDGNLIQYNLSRIFNSYLQNGCVEFYEEISNEFSNDVKNFIKFKCYQFRNSENDDFYENNFVGITYKQKIIIRTSKWEIQQEFESNHCTLLDVHVTSKNHCFIFVGCHKTLFVYEHSLEKPLNDQISFRKYEITTNFIKSLLICDETDETNPHEIGILLCDDHGNCTYSNSLNFQDPCIEFQLPFNKERWFTTAHAIKNRWFIVCSRQGHIYLYSWKNELKFTLKNIHGHFGVTQIKRIQHHDDDIHSANLYFKTSGRDGTIKTLKLNETDENLTVIHTEHVPITWISKFYDKDCSSKEDYNHDQLITGFNDNHFIIWTKNFDIIISIPCGGGHRYSEIFLNLNQNKILFVFSKNKKLFTYCIRLESDHNDQLMTIPLNRFHIKECNVLRTLNTITLNKDNEILLSGGEDNKLIFYNSKSNSYFYEIHSHISSIKDIVSLQLWHQNQPIRKGVEEFRIFSCGGRAQICVTKFLHNLNSNSILLNEEKCNFMMKLNDQQRKFHKNYSNYEINFDPEMRFMSIDVKFSSENEANFYELFTACSDGYIRKFLYTEKGNDNEMKLELELFYGRCILHVKVLRNYLITASTDGLICLWNLNELNSNSKSVFKLKHHKSGVNSLDVRTLENNRETDETVYIASGGDDQNVVVTVLKLNPNDETIEIVRQYELNDLHMAQVNGIKFSKCMKFLYVVGIDQIVCKLNVLDDMKLIKEAFTCVADVKGLEIYNSTIERPWECIVYGWGRQYISFE